MDHQHRGHHQRQPHTHRGPHSPSHHHFRALQPIGAGAAVLHRSSNHTPQNPARLQHAFAAAAAAAAAAAQGHQAWPSSGGSSTYGGGGPSSAEFQPFGYGGQHSEEHFGLLGSGAGLLETTPTNAPLPGRMQQQRRVPNVSTTVNTADALLTAESLGGQEGADAVTFVAEADVSAPKIPGQFEGLKLIPDPPGLREWREKLFNLEGVILMSQEEFQTYFPHVDNIYSHRSTQRYKWKPFVSHYWDCRLKGRPPGTPKSTDPDKKKRKRVARERDLCDVKIKITEYNAGVAPTATDALGAQIDELQQQSGLGTTINPTDFCCAAGQPGDASTVHDMRCGPAMGGLHPNQKYYTIQRVNGNGRNGKTDGVPGPHKHTLADSDRVKKNSVQRWLMKTEKEKKKVQQKTYHKKATGNALNTVKEHSAESDLKLYGSCFCPFVQRVWISLEIKRLSYQYIEVDPYKKPQSLLEVNPRGLVPALRHGPTWSCHESAVLMEYLEDLGVGQPLLPSHPQARAHCRLWTDHVNRHIIPAFYKYLQAQASSAQVQHAQSLKEEISKLVDAADPSGPFFLGSQISFVDVQVAPWVVRLNRVLKPYRGWPDPDPNSRWGRWVEAIESNEHVQATTSTDDLYLDSYERYAENRPNTSQLANAINSGSGLP